MRTMTVKELIKALEPCNPDAKLRVVGYPCGDEVSYTIIVDNEEPDDPIAFIEEVDR